MILLLIDKMKSLFVFSLWVIAMFLTGCLAHPPVAEVTVHVAIKMENP